MSQSLYSLTNNFSNDFSLRQFYGIMRDESFGSKLSNIGIQGDVVTVDWSPALSGSEESTLAISITGYVKEEGKWLLTGSASSDFGTYGTYVDGGVTKFTGHYRNIRTNKFVFFDNLEKEPITRLTIDEDITTGVSFADLAMRCLDIRPDTSIDEAPMRIRGFVRGEILAAQDDGTMVKRTPSGLDDLLIADPNIDNGVTFAKFDNKVFEFVPYSNIESGISISTIDNVGFTRFFRFTFSTDRSGKYRFGIYFNWHYIPDGRKIEVKGTLNTTNNVIFQKVENSNANDNASKNTDYIFGFDNIGASAHTFDLDFRTTQFGDEAVISFGRFEFERVGNANAF